MQKSISRTTRVALAATAFAAALAGLARANPELLKAEFARLDANKDGKLSLEEFKARPGGDAQASTAQASTAPSTTAAAEFARLDANKDGVLSEAEFTQRS